jgi:tetratricopeptide (TPR) repeat protein
MVGLVTVGMNGWSDRYLYVPIIGLAVAVLEAGRGLGPSLWQRVVGDASRSGDGPRELRKLVIGLAAAWLVALSLASWWLATQWRDTPTLAARTLATSSDRQSQWYAWTWLARHHVCKRDFATAEEFVYRAQSVAANPERAEEKLVVWHSALGQMWMDEQRYADAAREFAAVLRHRADHLEARLGLAVALSRAGEPERAAALFERLVADDPQCAVAWVGLGDFHLQAGRAAEAVRCLDRALAVKPDDAGAVTLRAWARVACGDRAGAEADAARRTQLGRPPDPDLLEAIGRIGVAAREPGS